MFFEFFSLQLFKKDGVLAGNLRQQPSTCQITTSVCDVHFELDVLVYYHLDDLTTRSSHHGLQSAPLRCLIKAQRCIICYAAISADL